jgi:hypothetical protein
MPPPVTRNSSKKALWEELECSREEIDTQQRELIEIKNQALKDRNELAMLRYQVKAMRAVLDLEFR